MTTTKSKYDIESVRAKFREAARASREAGFERFTDCRQYRKLLRRVEWHQRRYQEMIRANWRCECCGGTSGGLQAHHLDYVLFDGSTRCLPWLVPAGWLEVLCEGCHKWREHWNRVVGRSLMPTKDCKILAAELHDNRPRALLGSDLQHRIRLGTIEDGRINL